MDMLVVGIHNIEGIMCPGHLKIDNDVQGFFH